MAAAAPAAPFSSETLPDVSGKVLSGTCGWSDPTLLQCGRFYPRHLRSATAGPRLAFYSGPRGFGGTVEIDTSNYSLPSHKSVATWADSTPPGFTFHIKAFGLFASRTCQWRSLPRESREAAEKEAPWLAQRTNVKLEELPEAVVQGLWSRFNSLCELLYNRGKLGLVVFQFNRGCKPTWHNVQFITDLRRRLTPVATMAVEFRCRAWYVTDAACSYEGALRREAGMERPPSLPPGRNGVALGPGSTLGHVAAATVANLPLASRYVCRPWDEGHACLTSALATRSAEGVLSAASEWAAAPATVPPDSSPVMPNCQQVFTAAWLMALGIVHVASDDLLQEQGPAEEGHFARGTLPSTRLPVYPLVTSPAAAYVRVHRRRGQQRCLADAEVQRWALRLQAMAAQLRTLQGHLACLPTAPPVPQADAGLGVGSQSSAAEFVEPSAGYGPTPAQIRSGGMVVSVPAYASLVCGEGGQAAVGALFLMWGTDWEDQPLLNAKAVCGALPTAMVFPWQQHVKRHAKPVGISAFFQQQTSGPAAGGQPAEKARGSMPTAVAPCLVGGSEPRPRHLSPLAAAFAKSPPRGAKRDRAAAVDSACDISDGDDDGDEVELVSTAPAPAPKAKGLHAFFQASPKRKRTTGKASLPELRGLLAPSALSHRSEAAALGRAHQATLRSMAATDEVTDAKGAEVASSLAMSTRRFVDGLARRCLAHLLEGHKTSQPVDYFKLADDLSIQRRRVYDIINVLEGMRLVAKTSKGKLYCSPVLAYSAAVRAKLDAVIADTQRLVALEGHVDAALHTAEAELAGIMQAVEEAGAAQGKGPATPSIGPHVYITPEDIASMPSLRDCSTVAIALPPRGLVAPEGPPAGESSQQEEPVSGGPAETDPLPHKLLVSGPLGGSSGSRRGRGKSPSPAREVSAFVVHPGEESSQGQATVETLAPKSAGGSP